MSKTNAILIAPSILAADPLNLDAEVKSVEAAGADYHHVDVMDGHFVPNLTMGPPHVKALKKVCKIPLDVHIMVSNPDQVAIEYLEAGADILTFHAEAAVHPHRIIQVIKSKNKKAGIALNPGTPLEHVFALAQYVDLILIMSVNPGFGGQSFIPEALDRLRKVNEFLVEKKLKDQVLLEVDGGVTTKNSSQVISAGANMIVAGTAVYGANDRLAAIQGLRK